MVLAPSGYGQAWDPATCDRDNDPRGTMSHGHPDHRFICQEMWRRIQSVHPALAEPGKVYGLAAVLTGVFAVGDEDGV